MRRALAEKSSLPLHQLENAYDNEYPALRRLYVWSRDPRQAYSRIGVGVDKRVASEIARHCGEIGELMGNPKNGLFGWTNRHFNFPNALVDLSDEPPTPVLVGGRSDERPRRLGIFGQRAS